MLPVFAACVLWALPLLLSGRIIPSSELPETVWNLAITGTLISDPQGNVVGATIPLKRAGRLLLLEGAIDDVTGNFVLDTGSSELVLNKTYFRGSMTFDDEEGGGVTGATSAVVRISVKRFLVSELSYSGVSADVIPLGHLENRRGVKILGLFGMSLMKNMEMVLDVRNNQLQLFRLDRNGLRSGAPASTVKHDLLQKIDLFHNVMFVKATIGGKVLDFCLDTGAESNVLSIDANKKVLETVTITRRSELSGCGPRCGDVLYGTLNDFTLGLRKISPMATIVCSLESMSQKYSYPIDGMLGFDFFAQGRVDINLVKKEMGITFNREATP
jgi:predicted aspartyl protease